jgi:hypothetical protein
MKEQRKFPMDKQAREKIAGELIKVAMKKNGMRVR